MRERKKEEAARVMLKRILKICNTIKGTRYVAWDKGVKEMQEIFLVLYTCKGTLGQVLEGYADKDRRDESKDALCKGVKEMLVFILYALLFLALSPFYASLIIPP